MKQLLLTLFLITSAACASAQATHQVSTHILDITRGQPAAGVAITLHKWNDANKTWNQLADKKTDKEGRVKDLLPVGGNMGIYKLTFYTKPYFESLQTASFYPFVEVAFEIKDDKHYHVPITLSPYGYSTYRGS